MDWKILGIAIFAVILFGLIFYYYYEKRDVEGFVATFTPAITVQTDRFLSGGITPTNTTVTGTNTMVRGYSTIRGIQITSYAHIAEISNYYGYDSNWNLNTYAQGYGNTLPFWCTGWVDASHGPGSFNLGAPRQDYDTGTGDYVRNVWAFGTTRNYITSTQPYTKLEDIQHTRENGPTSGGPGAIDGYNNFLKDMSVLLISTTNGFMRLSPYYDSSHVVDHLSQYVGVYGTNMDVINNTWGGVVAWCDCAPTAFFCLSNIDRRNFGGPYGKLSNTLTFPASQVAAANAEGLQLNVYGVITDQMLSDFQQCIHWGALFNFTNLSYMESQINVPYYSQLDCMTAYYSHNLFLKEVQPDNANNYAPADGVSPNLITGASNYVAYNKRIVTLLEQGTTIANTRIVLPTNYDYFNVMNNHLGPITGSNEYVTPPSFGIDTRYMACIIGKTSAPNAPETIRACYDFTYGVNPTSSALSNTNDSLLTVLQRQYVGPVTSQILSYMPSMLQRYFTSYIYNRTIAILKNRLNTTVRYMWTLRDTGQDQHRFQQGYKSLNITYPVVTDNKNVIDGNLTASQISNAGYRNVTNVQYYNGYYCWDGVVAVAYTDQYGYHPATGPTSYSVPGTASTSYPNGICIATVGTTAGGWTWKNAQYTNSTSFKGNPKKYTESLWTTGEYVGRYYNLNRKGLLLSLARSNANKYPSEPAWDAFVNKYGNVGAIEANDKWNEKNARIVGYDYYSLTVDDLQTARLLAYADPTVSAWMYDYNKGSSPNVWFKKGCTANQGLTTDHSTVAIVEGNNNYATNYFRYYCGYITRSYPASTLTPPAHFMDYLTNLSVKTNLYGLYDDGETVSGNPVTNSNYIPYILQKYDDVAGWTWDGTNLNVILSNINIKNDGVDTGTNAYVDTTTTTTAVNTNKYVWSQSTTTLNVIQKMTDEYLNLLYPKRLLPSHDVSFNPVDKLMLNQIAQKYYEYSGGTAEMTFIYDVYPICSNMIDIRFRKQQHYNQASTISLFGSNIPQIETYNRLQDIYNNGTWINSYSNVDAILIDLSNALNALDPILNPVYPTVGSGYGNVYDIKKLMNANSNQTVILNGLLGNVVGGLNSNTTISTTTYAGSTITGVAAAVSVAGTSMLRNIAIYQEQLTSTINADQTLYNYLYGMETSVARVFITNRCIGNPDGSISTFYTDVNSNVSSLITVNGIALGQNAALSYNQAYNGNIEVDMGQSAGNVNYQPTIIYSCNINPVISCSNVEFIQRAAQLYVDSIYTNLSSIVSTSFPYDSNNGELRIDKVLGFYQLDSNTCGFTWQQSVYDIYTNQPSTSIVSVNMPFYYDESIYQTPQLLINNGRLDSNYPAAFTSTSISYPFISSNLTTDFYLDVQNISANIYNLIAPTGLATSIIPISTTFNTITTNINANTNYVSGLSLYNYSGALAPTKAIETIQNMPLKYYNYVTSNLSSFSTVLNSVYVPTMFNNWGTMIDTGIGATAWNAQKISTLKEFSSVDANFNQIPIPTIPNTIYKTTTSIIPSILGVKNASIYLDTAQTVVTNAQTAVNTAETARNTAQTAVTNAQTAVNNAQTAVNTAQTALNAASALSQAHAIALMALQSVQTMLNVANFTLQSANTAYTSANKVYTTATANLALAQSQQNTYFTILNNVRYDITVSPQYTSTPPTTLSGTTSSYTINLVPNGSVSSGSVNPSATTNKIILSFTINALTSGIGYINIGLLYNTGSGNNYINFSIAENGNSIWNSGPAFATGTYTISITNTNGTYGYIMTQNGTTVKSGTTPSASYAFFIGGGGNTTAQTITNVSYSLVNASGTAYQTITGPQPTGATGTGTIPPLIPILTMSYNAARQIVFTITNAPITATYIIIYCPKIAVSGTPPIDPNQYVDYNYYYVNIPNNTQITTYTLPAAIQKLMDPTLSYTFTSFAYAQYNTANHFGASTTITILPNIATLAGTQYIYNPGTTYSTTYQLVITNIYSGIFPQQLESYTYTLSTLFMYPYIDNSQKIPFSYITANISNYSTSLIQLSNSYSNLYAFNSFYKNTNYIPIYKALPYESYLDNANGACPAVNCENSNIMLSLIDQYNNDTDNTDNIVRILKGFTPNGYQCDYLVETIIDAPLTPADAIRTGVYNNATMAQNTQSYLYNIFWGNGIPDTNGATPFTTLNISDPIAKAQFWYGYIAMWANPPIYNITNTLGSTASPATTYMSNYIPTAWFPGYNYVYLYKNSLTHGQYQKLVYLPTGKTALSTPLPVLESDYSMMPIATTHLDSNDITNKQYPHDAALITSNSIQVYTTPLIYYLTDLSITPDAAGVFYQTITAVSPTTITGTNTSYTINLSPGGAIDSSPFFTPRFGETITLAFTISPLNTGTGYINIGLYKASDPIIAYFSIAEDGSSIYTGGPVFTAGAYSITIANDSTYANNTTYTYNMYQQTTLIASGTTAAGAYTMFIGGGGNTSAQTIRFVSCKMQSVTALKITDAKTTISSAKTTFDSASAALSVANADLVSATADMDAKNVALNAANLDLNAKVSNFMLAARSSTPPIYNGSTTGMDAATVTAQGAFNIAYNAQVDANTAFTYAQRVVSGELITSGGMTTINPTLTPAFNPSNTCVDLLGNTYIAEYKNNRVIKLDPLGIVTTIAFSATTALNVAPKAVITDSQNNLYIGTVGNNSTPGNYIYKITAASLATATPTLVIFAGKGTAATNTGKYGTTIDTVNDNCVPTNVPFNLISSLAVDSQDNLYVADGNVPFIAKISGNIFSKLNRFTEFNLTRINSVLYGYIPYNIVIDSQDNMYVAAKQSAIVLAAYKPLILKKEKLSIEFTIFAGKSFTDLVNGNKGDDDLATSATFKSPVGVAVDNLGNVYVADDTSNVIRKIDVLTGIISRFISELTRPIKIYFNKNTKNFYIIQTIDTTNTLIIADPKKFALNRTLVLQNAQSAQTAAQTNVLNLQNNFKLLTSSGNNIYFDGRYFIVYNNSRYDINLATQNIYNTTNTIVFANYFIINMESMSIITAIQAWHTSYIAALNTPFSLIDMKWSSKLSKDEPYQMMWFTALNNGMFGSGSYDALTKAFFPGSNASVVSYNALSPPAPAVASVPFKTFNITNVTDQNKLFYSYVALWASPKVQTIPSSCLNKYWQTSWFPGYNYILIYQNSAGINQYQKISNYPTVSYGGILSDLSMNLIAPTYNDPNVYGYKADEDTNGDLANTINTVIGSTTVIDSNTLNSPYAVHIDTIGNIYIADYVNKRVIRKTPSDTYTIIKTPTEPIAIVTNSVNNLYIATIGNYIYKVSAASAATNITISNTATYIYAGTGVTGFGGAVTDAAFQSPYGLAVDSADNLYISDYGNNRVKKISYTTGTITTIAGGGFSGFTEGASATSVWLNGPFGIAIDSLGSIYIGEYSQSCRIRKVTSGIITTFAGTGTVGYSGDGGVATSANISNPRSITLDSANNVYFTDYANNVIRKIDTTNRITTYISGLSQPGTIDFDNTGILYIADTANNRVIKILKTSPTPTPTYTAATNPITTTMYSVIASATATTPGKDTLATLTTKFWPSGVGNTAGTPITSLSITSDYVKYQYWYAYVALNATPLNYPLNSLLPTYMNNYIATTWFPGYNYVYLYKNNANNGQYQKLVNAPSTVKISTLTYMGNFNEKAYLKLNPTIASAVTSGTYVSGYQHWSTIGYKSDLKGTGMIVATNNNSPVLQTDIKLPTSSDYGIMPIATTYIDTTDTINLLFQDDILDSSTTSNAIKNVVYGTHPDLVVNTFFPPNNAIGTPFVKFNILDLLSQYKFYYSYVASCVKPLTIKPFTYSILDTDIGNYYATSWFQGYNYIYTYKNSRLNGQYQKLISLPVGKTATQLVSCDIGSHTAYATTHVDSNDPTNLYYQDEQMPTGVKVIKNKTFEVALNLIDCTYMYFSTNNTGYYIQDNTPYVPDTRNDISGFQFIPSLFTTFSDKVLNLLSPLITQGTTVATEMSNVYSSASTVTNTSFSNVFSIAYPIPAVTLALDNTNTNLANDLILTFTNPGSEAGYKVDIRDNNNPTNTASISIKKSSLLNNTYTISGLYPAVYTFNISSSNSARYGISNIYTVYSSPNTQTFTYVAKTGPVVLISGTNYQSNIIVSYPNAPQYNRYFGTTYLDSYTGLVVTKTVNKDTTTFPDYTNNIISDLIPDRTYTFSNYSGYSALPLFNGIMNISSLAKTITATIQIRPIPNVSITSPASPSKTAKFTFTPAVWVPAKSYETNYCITYTDTYGAHSCNTAPTSPGTTNATTYTITGLVGGASYTFNVFSYYTIYNVAATGTPTPVMVSSLIKTLSPITIQAFENYVRPQEYDVKYVLIESSKPFSVPIQIYDNHDMPVVHNVSKRDNGVLLTLDTTSEIAGFSFTPGKYDPIDFTLKGTKNGKDWIFTHKQKFNKYSDISPLFYFNGTTKKIKAVKQEIQKTQETPQFDIQILQKYYKQKINPSIIPQYKSYMYVHDAVYFLYDEYDLNKKLVAADLVIGYVIKDGKVKKAILYEDEDGNSSGFDFSKKAVQRFWDTYIMVELNFASPVII